MRLGPIAFFTIVTLLFTGVHAYLWWRLVRSTTTSGRKRKAGAVAIALLGLLAIVAFIVTRTVGVDATWLAWAGYTWIALFLYLVLALLVLEIPRAVAALRRRRRSEVDEPRDPARRLFLARSFAVTAGVVAVGAVGTGMRTAYGDLRVDRLDVPLPRLDSRLDGFRIAVVGDVHLGPFMRADFAERVVDMVNREQPDLIAIVGDLADGTVDELRAAVEPISRLRAPSGAFFVTGNHEYSSGAPEWVQRVGDLGLRTLRNERVEITARGAAFDLAGVNDPSAEMYDPAEVPDYAAALGDRDPARPVVLLAHQPIQAVEADKFGVDLQLSGHTHGGQTIPIDRVTRVVQPVVAGLGLVGSTRVYVTRGAGFFGPPVRTGVIPEISLVQLRSG